LKNWLIDAALCAERDVSVANGVTMMQYRLKRSAAFELLRTFAPKQRCKLTVLTVEIIQTCETLKFLRILPITRDG